MDDALPGVANATRPARSITTTFSASAARNGASCRGSATATGNSI